MANTQYIGARYVPLVADPFQWDINSTYEPLTIVGNNGSSYTSRKAVPAGIEISNTEYWALTSLQSGAVTELQDRVSTLETQMDTAQKDINDNMGDVTAAQADIAKLITQVDGNTKRIANIKMTGYPIPGMKNVILLGDSYAARSNSWFPPLKTMLGIPEANIKTSALGGVGYVAKNNNSFQSMITALKVDMNTEWAENVTHIIVGTAGNDYSQQATAVQEAVDSFAQYCRSNFPNANIYNAYIGRNIVATVAPRFLMTTISVIANAAIKNGIFPCYGTESALYLKEWMMSDGVHPTQPGCNQIAKMIYSAILNGGVRISSTPRLFEANDVTGITGNYFDDFWEYMMDGLYHLSYYQRPRQMNLTAPIETASSYYEIGEFNSRIIYGTVYNYNVSWPGWGIGTRDDRMPGYFYVAANKLYFAPSVLGTTGLTAISFQPFTLELPLQAI